MLSLSVKRVGSLFTIIGVSKTVGDVTHVRSDFTQLEVIAEMREIRDLIASKSDIRPRFTVQGCCRCNGHGWGTWPNTTDNPGVLRSGICFRCRGLGASGVIRAETARIKLRIDASIEEEASQHQHA